MDVNTNTRIRWEEMKRIPELSDLRDRRVLDVGSGLGYFSLRFAERGAKVRAVDIDAASLEFLRSRHGLETTRVDIESEELPGERFDLVFLGEVLEHAKDPAALLGKAVRVLAPEGVLLITTPALEGALTDTKGKALGHETGAEKHERNGFSLGELQGLLGDLGLKFTFHTYTVFYLAELFMQLTKLGYLRGRREYHSQSDIIGTTGTLAYRGLRAIYPALLTLFRLENRLSRWLRVRGHCHVLVAKRVVRA